MSSVIVRAAFAVVLLLFVAAVEAQDGGVSFWRMKFTMKCPQNGTWFEGEKQLATGETLELQFDNSKKGPYHCEYAAEEDENTKIKYYFYVEGKVCENCFELDGKLFLIAIIGDGVMTAAVMYIIFKCTKKKGPAEVTHTSKPPARSGGRAQPASSSEYEQLNSHTRTVDTYSIVNRMG